MAVMADVRALGVFQERVKTLLGSLVEVLLSEITEACRESFPVNMSMNLCEKCFLNNPPESIKGDRDGFRAESEQSQPLTNLRCSDTVIPQQATSGGLKVMEAALNKSDSPNRLCPAPQEARDTNETTLDTAVTEDNDETPLEEGKEKVEITHGVEHDADVKPMENEPAQSESSNQKLACDQSQKRASLDAGQSVSSMLGERTWPCSVQLDTIPIFERSGSKFYVCSFCSKIFMFAKTLKRHKRLHISKRPNSCLKSFNLRKTLLKHKKEHFKKLYSCTRCGKKYAHWRNLHLHWSCHAGRSPFLCFQCGKCCRTVLKRRRNLIKPTITD